jgi:hypothetical protein
MKHHQYIQLYQLNKSTVTANSINLGHCIQLQDASILAKKSKHIDQIIKEVIQLVCHPNKNWEDGFSLSRSLKPLNRTLKEQTRLAIPFCLSLSMVLIRAFIESARKDSKKGE